MEKCPDCPKCRSEHVEEIVVLRGIDFHYKCKDCKETWFRPRLMSKEDLARLKSNTINPMKFRNNY